MKLRFGDSADVGRELPGCENINEELRLAEFKATVDPKTAVAVDSELMAVAESRLTVDKTPKLAVGPEILVLADQVSGADELGGPEGDARIDEGSPGIIDKEPTVSVPKEVDEEGMEKKEVWLTPCLGH